MTIIDARARFLKAQVTHLRAKREPLRALLIRSLEQTPPQPPKDAA